MPYIKVKTIINQHRPQLEGTNKYTQVTWGPILPDEMLYIEHFSKFIITKSNY